MSSCCFFRFYNVMFEIGQDEDDVGKFEVSAKILSVSMENDVIALQVH